MRQYDLAIIGGGAGAFAAAIRANELGANTVVINDGLPLGGTCVNVGCVPSKTLLHAAELIHTAKHHNVPGIVMTVDTADYAAVVADELALVAELRDAKYEKVLSDLDNVTLIKGKASFVSSHQLQVGEKRFDAAKFIIATGSKAIVPEVDGLAEAGYITHIEAMSLRTVPERLAVIGAGPVGLELAQLYARFGSKVTILQKGNRILPIAEPDLTKRLQQILQDEGLDIKTGVKVTKVMRGDNQKTITYRDSAGEHSLDIDEILLAAGKRPNTAALNLSAIDVKMTERQEVITEPTLHTSQPYIFAIGDVTNLPLRLETTAGKEGTYAVDNALNSAGKSIDYRSVPWAVFTDPQLSGVGYSEDEQMAELKACACRTVTFDKLPKALITRRTEGVIKIAIHPETRAIMGVHILAPEASDLIAQAMVLIRNRNTIDDLEEMLPVFPTLAEVIKLAAMSFTRDITKMSCCI